MKKQLSGFAAGVFTATLVGALGFTALAATGQVSFNASALSLNGAQVSAKGENYTLANGQSVPSSITYTDEKGGGTTYLPVRRISELLGVETGWDGATGSVTINSAALPSQPPVTTAPPTDYSDWSKEDEAAYQEFKGLWTVEYKRTEKNVGTMCDIYLGYLAPPNTIESAKKYYSSNQITLTERFIARMMSELMKENDVILMLSSENKTIPEDARDTGNDIGDYRLYSSNPNGPAWYYHFLKP